MVPQRYLVDYSIIICAYNPDDRLLKRCLKAVFNLDRKGMTTEVILVDNNSSNPVESMPYVQDYLRKMPDMKTLLVAAQGVKNARIAAITEAAGKYIIYFDYDNEPQSNYLQELKLLNKKYPKVAAWGPGELSIDFIDGIDNSIENYARIAFQERHDNSIKLSAIREWQSCYPFGPGLCTYSFLLNEYIALARQGKFTMSGRNPNELTSGEDTQMVLLCVSKGYFAGVSPTLQMKHIVPEVRANYKYLQRLAYDTSLCYESCLVQAFPEHKEKLRRDLISESKFVMRSLKKYVKAKLRPDHHERFDLIEFIASNAGAYIALNKAVPPAIKQIVKNLKLEEV